MEPNEDENPEHLRDLQSKLFDAIQSLEEANAACRHCAADLQTLVTYAKEQMDNSSDDSEEEEHQRAPSSNEPLPNDDDEEDEPTRVMNHIAELQRDLADWQNIVKQRQKKVQELQTAVELRSHHDNRNQPV